MTDAAYPPISGSDELTDCPSFKGCCDGPEWRGHLCQYHQGWVDGYDAYKQLEAQNA